MEKEESFIKVETTSFQKQTKIEDSESKDSAVGKLIERISETLELNDEFQLRMNVFSPNPKIQDNTDPIKSAICQLANRVPSVIKAISWLYDHNQKMEKKMSEMEAVRRQFQKYFI